LNVCYLLYDIHAGKTTSRLIELINQVLEENRSAPAAFSLMPATKTDAISRGGGFLLSRYGSRPAT
jgi:hypothetical protein